jgi:DNA polymerase III epsilon subunit-like protein
MKIVYIYCQTNGLHQTNEDVTKKNLFEFARLVSLNYEIISPQKKVNVIIKPRCMFIDENTIKIHGITNEIAKEKGIEIEEVLKNFKEDLKGVDIIVTHNQSFHLKTIMGEFSNSRKSNILGTITFAVMTIAALILLFLFFFAD